MHVERFLTVWPQGLYHIWSDRDIRHKMPVHDVDMDIVGTRLINRTHFFAEAGEVCREDRRGYTRGLLHNP